MVIQDEEGNVSVASGRRPREDEEVLLVARICHAVNTAYCRAIGDPAQDWDDLPQDTRDSAARGVVFRRDNPGATGKAMHQKWMEDKLSDGWKHGPVKDVEKREHPNLVSYHELPISQRLKDDLFMAVCDAFFQQE